jgi:LruC domain-containing protein
LIKDETRELLLMGFEDVNRDLGGCDHDFNDALFYVTANPYEAIITEYLPEIDVSDDADDDGVSDLYDDYPNDDTRCFNNYYPSDGNYSTLAFEDLWPSKGDYDYNDLVIDYQHNRVTNNENVIIEMISDFRITGVLAGFQHNALGVELPITSSRVSSISGNRVENNFFSLNSNGTEAGHSNAVIPVFDHAGDNFTSRTNPDSIIITTTFSSGISLTELAATPYNPFLVVSRDRGREVHLSGDEPTALADQSLFKSMHDNTDVNISNQTYKTATNLPWAINIPESFNYPKESTPINTTYFYFIQWAESEGTFYTDWYENKEGYRNESNLSF